MIILFARLMYSLSIRVCNYVRMALTMQEFSAVVGVSTAVVCMLIRCMLDG